MKKPVPDRFIRSPRSRDGSRTAGITAARTMNGLAAAQKAGVMTGNHSRAHDEREQHADATDRCDMPMGWGGTRRGIDQRNLKWKIAVPT